MDRRHLFIEFDCETLAHVLCWILTVRLGLQSIYEYSCFVHDFQTNCKSSSKLSNSTSQYNFCLKNSLPFRLGSLQWILRRLSSACFKANLAILHIKISSYFLVFIYIFKKNSHIGKSNHTTYPELNAKILYANLFPTILTSRRIKIKLDHSRMQLWCFFVRQQRTAPILHRLLKQVLPLYDIFFKWVLTGLHATLPSPFPIHCSIIETSPLLPAESHDSHRSMVRQYWQLEHL